MKSTWERFQSATLSLARSGSIKERLNDAYRKHLADLQSEDVPELIRDDFHALSCSLRREPPLVRGDDPVRATIRKMSDAEANVAATSVVRMFAALPRTKAQTRVRTKTSRTAKVVTLYMKDAH